MSFLYLLGGFYTLALLIWVIGRVAKIPTDIKEKQRIEGLAGQIGQRESKLANEMVRFENIKKESSIALDKISREKALGFPWLASAYSEYRELYDLKVANELETKDHPARRAADEVRIIAAEKAALRRENKILRELHRYYESLFPWLIEFKGEDLDELIRQVNQPKGDIDPDEEPAYLWLSDAERESTKLTRSEKFQKALDRYWKSKKSPWQLGRDYERYIGYLYDDHGFKVEYHGIEMGYEDMGRDLICTKGKETRVVQCKYWNVHRTLHEKHICQIFGTAMAYKKKLETQGELFEAVKITPWLYVSCTASPTAKDFAKMLDVELRDNYLFKQYPIIKCNVSRRNGEKIYHLPFDQQYDRTLIEFEDECYVQTVAEAEGLGFRRAFRWRGNQSDRR